MEQVGAREQVQYAGLGWRFAAIAVDTVVLFFLLVVIFAVMTAAGALDLKDPAFSDGIDLQRTAPVWMYAITYGLIFVYYTLLEALTAASVGKLVFRMRVTMDDGTRPSGLAVVVRNLIRLPEVLFWYIPSGISCLTNAKNKRLGDLAAKTVVVRRGATPVGVRASGPVRSWP
ncbi:MAG TPA: RDD family protein, partial [Coriobacteriia bacterium]